MAILLTKTVYTKLDGLLSIMKGKQFINQRKIDVSSSIGINVHTMNGTCSALKSR